MSEGLELFQSNFFPLPRSPRPGRGAAKGIARRHLGRRLWLYAIHDETAGAVKIGVSLDVDKRFLQICAGSASDLVLTTAVSVFPSRVVGLCEEYVHEVLRLRLVRGEWFKIHPACADTVIRLSLSLVRRYSHPDLPNEAVSIAASQCGDA
ncbi:GIY-YIG nuclease family protein [Mameliella sp. MMSF_3552]|uniref:GIY-YIG nuclease family protein n=1 Tax=unclassified Mameliella TaxID=2630630 RepID=UPI00353198C0